jgi:hypothetical protein
MSLTNSCFSPMQVSGTVTSSDVNMAGFPPGGVTVSISGTLDSACRFAWHRKRERLLLPTRSQRDSAGVLALGPYGKLSCLTMRNRSRRAGSLCPRPRWGPPGGDTRVRESAFGGRNHIGHFRQFFAAENLDGRDPAGGASFLTSGCAGVDQPLP